MANIIRYGFFFLFDKNGKPRITHCVGFADRITDDIFVSTAICGIHENPDVREGLLIAKKRVDRMAKTGKSPRGNEIVSQEALLALAACGKTLSGKLGWTPESSWDSEWIQNKCYYGVDRKIIKSGGWMREFKDLIRLIDEGPILSKFSIIVTKSPFHPAGKVAVGNDFDETVSVALKYFEEKCISQSTFKRIPVEPIENASQIDRLNQKIDAIAKRIDTLSKKIRTA